MANGREAEIYRNQRRKELRSIIIDPSDLQELTWSADERLVITFSLKMERTDSPFRRVCVVVNNDFRRTGQDAIRSPPLVETARRYNRNALNMK